MYHIRPGQIKAARAILGWSQDELAATSGFSVTTIRNIESGDMSPRGATMNKIGAAIENAGLEFIEPEGIRRRTDDVYNGPDRRTLFTALGFLAVILSDAPEKNQAPRAASIAKLIESFCVAASPDAPADEQQDERIPLFGS